MGDHHQLMNQSGGGANVDRVDAVAAVAAEPVRTRWTPKPEQILILESIFNSGTVNPPKDETVRIRKLLERFGSVGDANVFYWFQNRRSRSRRRQRQMLQAAAGVVDPRNSNNNHVYSSTTTAGIIPSGAGGASTTACWSSVNSSRGPVGFEHNYSQYDPIMTSTTTNYNSTSIAAAATSFCTSPGGLLDLQQDHDDGDDDAEDLFSISRQMRNINNRENCSSSIITDDQTATMQYPPALMSTGHCSTGAASLCFPSGLITVFINGSLQEVPRGAFDVRAVFGQDVMLLHSSGELVPMNDYGILFHGLFPGESYFLVPRSM